MDSTKLALELTAINMCEVLKEHVLFIFGNMDIEKLPRNMGESTSWIIEQLSEAQTLGLYGTDTSNICIKHNVAQSLKKDVIEALETYAILYCFYSTYQLTSPDISTELQKLKKYPLLQKNCACCYPAPKVTFSELLKSSTASNALTLTPLTPTNFSSN